MAPKETIWISRTAGPAEIGILPFKMAAKARIGLACTILCATAVALRGQQLATLPGHVPAALRNATIRPRDPQSATERITFTVFLKLTDVAGFEAFSQSLNDPDSPNYRHPISALEITTRFGPTPEAYSAVLSFLEKSGFTLVTGSENRRTLTVRGTRAQAEAAFQISIDDYQLGSRTFHATATDPSVPTSLAPLIGGVSGLSNLPQMRPQAVPTQGSAPATGNAYNGAITPQGSTNSGGGLPPGLDGSGQVVGLFEQDNYTATDLKDTLRQNGLSGSLSQVQQIPISGGTTPGANEEVLLDIVAVLGIAPGATVIVFDAPAGTDPLSMANAAIGQVNAASPGGIGGIISTSWSSCEVDTNASDAQNLDDLLKTAAASGLTFFANTGDYGSTCVDSSAHPGTIAYPADVPHAIAVGGTYLTMNSSDDYISETWWAGSGFGVSTIFKTEPTYQSSLYSGAGGRSVPDVVAEAGPGIAVCTSSSPACIAKGGTSMAAPLWAGVWALVSQAFTDAADGPGSTSASNGYLYSFPKAFHSAASMSSDFAHVGLGSPDITTLVSNASPRAYENSINPSTGEGKGGSTVTVQGVGFIGVSKVTFGGVDATNVTIHSDTELTAESPAAPSAAPVEINITTPAGNVATNSYTFSYFPYVSKVSPSAGAFFGGDTVTVTGFALSDKYTFNFGNSPATHVSCSSNGTQCAVVTPPNAAGIVPVQVVAPVGDSLIALYTYENPSITSLTPSLGPTTGGLPKGVTINGTALKTGMTVTFGDSPTTAVTCNNPTVCFVQSPSHAPGSVHVTVTVDGITSAPSTQAFNFEVYPTIISIAPSVIPINTSSLATQVTLTIIGTGFATTGTTFNLNGVAGLADTKCNSSLCTGVLSVPPDVRTTTTAQVTVTADGLTSTDSVGLSYPYAPPPRPVCKGDVCN